MTVMIVTVIMTVIVMIMTVIVARMTHVVEEDQADQIDDQSPHRRQHQLVLADRRRLADAFDRLQRHTAANKHQENAIDIPGEDFHALVAEREGLGGGPLGHVGGDESDDQRAAVEEHVSRVADQSERVVPDPCV